MKAVGYTKSLPVDDDACLEDVEIDDPVPGPRDLLVEVRAVSVNPVDTKVRMRAAPESGHKVLGYDAAGVVRAVGDEVTLFAPGDEVWYAGDVTRPGTNSALHVVDERIVSKKPSSLDFAAAAALPLTAITAWEILFDCFALDDADDGNRRGRDAARDRRRRRRGLDPDPAGEGADLADRRGHRVARRHDRLVPGHGGRPRDRPSRQPARTAGEARPDRRATWPR